MSARRATAENCYYIIRVATIGISIAARTNLVKKLGAFNLSAPETVGVTYLSDCVLRLNDWQDTLLLDG